jgi:hypothetical protein
LFRGTGDGLRALLMPHPSLSLAFPFSESVPC